MVCWNNKFEIYEILPQDEALLEFIGEIDSQGGIIEYIQDPYNSTYNRLEDLN